MKKRYDLLIVLILLALMSIACIFVIVHGVKKQHTEKNVTMEQEKLEEEQCLKETEAMQEIQAESAEKEIEEMESDTDEVVIQYQGEDAALSIIEEKEESLSEFLLQILSGNGVLEETVPVEKKTHEVTIKDASDQGMYIYFTGVLYGDEVSMIYYKDTGIFALREENTQPGRTNNYQEVE